MSYCGIGLYNPKSSCNVGSALRAAECYGADFIAATGIRYQKSATDTSKSIYTIPLFQVEDLHKIIPYACVPVAIEFISTSTSLFEYKHPDRAFYIFGPEDGTLGHKVLDWCRDIVYIPTKICMNLAATINVVLYDRMCKE